MLTRMQWQELQNDNWTHLWQRAGFLGTLKTLCKWSELAQLSNFHAILNVICKKNRWGPKTAAIGPGFSQFSFASGCKWLEVKLYDLRMNTCELLIACRRNRGICNLFSQYHWKSSVKRNEALIETVVNIDGGSEEMQCKIGWRIWCSHMPHGSGNEWIVFAGSGVTQEALLKEVTLKEGKQRH